MSDPFVEIMDPLRLIRERIHEVGASCGLDIVHVGFLPGQATEGPHEVQIMAVLADSPPESPDGFEQVIREARDAEIEGRSQTALADLNERLRGGKGFLDEPPGDT